MLGAIGRGLRAVVINLLIFLVIVEVFLQIAVRFGLLPVSLPSYSLSQARPFWADVNADWGVWHVPNSSFRHLKSCFDVSYASNSHGMRDRELEKTGDSARTVVLGDSFVEGWGVAYGERFTERLEEATGREHLNFGTSGDFGSTQAFVLYERFGSGFSHDAVLWAILPANDFRDDRPSERRLREGARWRPYLVGAAPDFTLSYPAGAFAPKTSWGKFLENIPREFFVSVRAWFYFEKLIEAQNTEPPSRESRQLRSMYWDYKPEGVARLAVAAQRIRQAAGDRPIKIVSIPRPNDMERTKSEGAAPPLRAALRDLAARIDAEYLDLMEPFAAADWSGYYLSCDGHWTAAGHQAAAKAINGAAAAR